MRDGRFNTVYIFAVVSILLIVSSLYIYSAFINAKESILAKDLKSNISYVDDISKNVIATILDVANRDKDDTLYETLLENREIIDEKNRELGLFVTSKYKYIYVVDRDRSDFRFLLDGAKKDEDKSEFGERYLPIKIAKYNEVYESRESIYYFHSEVETLWVTYLKPIVVGNIVQAILVVDFSIQDHKAVESRLKEIDSVLLYGAMFGVFIFIILFIFLYLDIKRENIKDSIFSELEKKSQEIEELNSSLEDRVQIEIKKNRKKDKQMIDQSRLAQMGEMISMIAHQWRQPLSAISSTSSALSLKAIIHGASSDEIEEATTNISNYVQHLSTTIDDFREFFKPNKKRQNTTYGQLLKSAISIVELSLKSAKIELIKEVKEDRKIYTYSSEISQVILNLLKNAKDVLTDNEIEKPYIKVTLYEKNSQMHLVVCDNGGGVPEEVINEIFNPYFSTKKAKDGTGLGLYMSKTIMNEHCDGDLSVTNSASGACFKMSIPIAQDES